MRLLLRSNNGEFSLTKEFVGDDIIPPYAILSHTWREGEEVTFKDLIDGTGQGKAGHKKIRFCGQQAERDGLQYFWVDTCCIDKSDQVILQNAINSMFRWYQNARICYVYLSDVSTAKRKVSNTSHRFTWEPAFRQSTWFTRGWTLQELLAPRSVKFFSCEGKELGDKTMLQRQIHEVTGIATRALQGAPLCEFTIEERLSWTRSRQTTYKEDKAYSLLGMFDICMPLLYGEGEEKAFRRLRRKITKVSNGVHQRKHVTTPAYDISFPQNRSIAGKNDELDLLKRELMLGRECKKMYTAGLAGTGKTQVAAVTKVTALDSLPLNSSVGNPARPEVSDSSSESLAVDYPFFNREPLTEQQARAFLTAVVLLGELLKGLEMIGPRLFILLTILQSVPPRISNLLPDNILFHDALGRRYSLNLAHFKDWSVLDALLQEQFKECPEFSKVKQHQFGIIDIDEPERMITELRWGKVVGRRKRFRMIIFISQFQERQQFNVGMPFLRYFLRSLGIISPKSGPYPRKEHASSRSSQPRLVIFSNQIPKTSIISPPEYAR
ncbi:hypothetical protein NX059_004980 [Plenodomus lindquistii]|nr:hypothetical protein NX059_004980 [Plenodomus lindquistii]